MGGSMVCKSVTPSRVEENFKIWDFKLDDGDMKVTLQELKYEEEWKKFIDINRQIRKNSEKFKKRLLKIRQNLRNENCIT